MDVLRLDVAVDDLLGMDVFERSGDLQGDPQLIRVARRSSPALMASRRSWPTRNSITMNGRAVFLAEIEDLDDVLVLDIAGHTRFLEETRFGLRIGAALFRQNLYRDGAADHGVLRPVDVRHAAAQELL